MPIFNSITSWLLKKRYHQIDLFIKFPHDVQIELLNQLLNTAKGTELGKQYDFESITNYEAFRERLPLVTYEDIEPMISRSRKGEKNIFWPGSIRWFAKSSGTTNNKSKYIPLSKETLEDCHYKSGKDLLCLYLNNNEDSQLFSGKSLRLGGSKELYEDNGTYFGDLSSILIDNMPFWAEMSSTPSNKVSLMQEWESKIEAIANETVNENVTSLAGVPSWMLLLLNRVLEKTGKRNILDVWPNAEVYFHGGVSFTPYWEQYSKLFPSQNFRYYQTYNASEGFFAIQDKNNSPEMLLMLDYGIFYEFIVMDTYHSQERKAIPLWEVEKNKSYAIVISTNSGLWRYILGDTIRFTSLFPYRIKITGRTKHFLNVFGEEIVIENTDEALKKACRETASEVVDYTVAPIFMKDNTSGGHEWLIEFKVQPRDISAFSEILDKALQSLNSDYEAKRYRNMAIDFPKLNVAKPDLFYNWLKKQNKLGGQNKVPRLYNERVYIEELLQMNSEL